ncbi:MAG: TetR/AcrR family transcriptional regulator [Deltaproteobacteria bacterium]|nr:TetR/AcrR family transcriptional regulator [Candidatus Zymogenaceae bacterium]
MPKPTFLIISEEKRNRIYDAAALEFAREGYEKANIKNIADRAGVSKGSLYDYFDSKEDLYLDVCTHGITMSRNNIDSIIDDDKDFFAQVKDIFHQGLGFVGRYPQYAQLYVNISSSGMERFAEKLTLAVEKHTADYYKTAIKRGIDDGFIRPDLDVDMAAFLINSMYVMMIISIVSRHYRIRLGEYLNLTDDRLEQGIRAKIDQVISIVRFSMENSRKNLIDETRTAG